MRVLLIHPNYHSRGAEIAGNWPPAWVAYLTGYLKAGGFHDVIFVDAMTNHLTDEQVRQHLRSATAFIFAAGEDFGIAPVEALARGTPVVAYARGGALGGLGEGLT